MTKSLIPPFNVCIAQSLIDSAITQSSTIQHLLNHHLLNHELFSNDSLLTCQLLNHTFSVYVFIHAFINNGTLSDIIDVY